MADRFLIVSDVDGTLLGDDAALAEFGAWLEPRRDAVLLALNSGRFTDSLRQSVSAARMPAPDALIGGVGTEIVDEREGLRLDDWPRLAGDWSAARVRRVMATEDRVALQPVEFLSQYKVSYYAHDASESDLAAWKNMLNNAGLAVELVYSSGRDLDILPAGVTKGSAAAHLAETWDVPPQRVIVCGDTHNDLSMFQQGFRGVVVGNALAELKSLDGPDTYHSERRFAAGVLEGVEHWMALA